MNELKERLDKALERIGELENKIEEQDNKIEEQDNKIEEQDNKIEEQDNKIEEQEYRFKAFAEPCAIGSEQLWEVVFNDILKRPVPAGVNLLEGEK
jgi:molecular chaperone GrpE